jgi:hypothetical protein
MLLTFVLEGLKPSYSDMSRANIAATKTKPPIFFQAKRHGEIKGVYHWHKSASDA